MDLGIAGKTAAVAASSGGLGFASAQALVEAGVRVVICGRDPERLSGAAAKLGDLAVPIWADVSTPEGAASFVADARREVGPLDILVPNAGGPPAGTIDSVAWEAYRPALEQNLLSTVAMCRAAVPEMVERGWGRVVAITSFTVRQPAPGMVLSNTARAGATAFLKTLSAEVASKGVTVNTVQPGSHATDRLRQLHGDLEKAARGVPTGELGRPEDFGAVVAFLCSDAARFITGASLPVDGGASHSLQ